MSLPHNFWPIFTVAYLVFSGYGFFLIRDYSIRCVQSGCVPFGGSILKIFVYSILCGVFTTLVLLFTIVESFWDGFSSALKKMRKK